MCDNNLFIYCPSVEHKENILQILSNGMYLFQSFVILHETSLECYGTYKDIYIDYITIDIDTDPCLISLLFRTDDFPPLQFCKKIAIDYNINVQLVYFNKENNYSGEFSVKDKVICCNQIKSYYQGLYIHENNLFWETIEESFEESQLEFENYYQKMNIELNNMDKQFLKDLFDDFAIVKKFQKM